MAARAASTVAPASVCSKNQSSSARPPGGGPVDQFERRFLVVRADVVAHARWCSRRGCRRRSSRRRSAMPEQHGQRVGDTRRRRSPGRRRCDPAPASARSYALRSPGLRRPRRQRRHRTGAARCTTPAGRRPRSRQGGPPAPGPTVRRAGRRLGPARRAGTRRSPGLPERTAERELAVQRTGAARPSRPSGEPTTARRSRCRRLRTRGRAHSRCACTAVKRA